MSELPGEFALIARHFRPLAAPEALGLGDDAAFLTPPPGHELVLSADAMVEGVHFLPADPPELVARKLLRVNLSDLAAKGAAPLGYLLTLAAPRATPDAWFAAFAAGLAADQARYGIGLFGGDTTSTPGPITLSLTILGTVASGKAVHRTGARAGYGIWVSGTIGDAALGLAALQGRLADPTGALAARYHLPEPRLGLVRADLVAACLDVSDGLVQDLGHLCRAGGVNNGGVGAEIEAALVPRSAAARAAGPAWLATCLTGGDDYEVLMAVPPEHEPALAGLSTTVPRTRIGRFVPGAAAVRVRDEAGGVMMLDHGGWSHF